MNPRSLGRIEGFTVACLLVCLLLLVVTGVAELADRLPGPRPCFYP